MSEEKRAEPRILLIDIETFPNLAFVWGKYEQNVLAFERERILASFSAKWLGGQQITKALPDYPLYEENSFDDSALLADVWALIDEADVCIAHNGDNFDFKTLNARFVHTLGPPSPYQTVDTYKVAKAKFMFNSNKLNDLGVHLKLGQKVKHSGFDLWVGCMRGDEKSWSLMKRYNAQDVKLLELVYRKFLPWISSHPNRNAFNPSRSMCPKCGSGRLQARGQMVSASGSFQRFHCQACGGWSRQAKNSKLLRSA